MSTGPMWMLLVPSVMAAHVGSEPAHDDTAPAAKAAQDCKVRWAGPHAIVTMPAAIDVMNAYEIRQMLLGVVSQLPAVLVIDMTQTTFCDCAGVHAIIAAQEQATTVGTQLRLAATTVLRILTLTGTDQRIPIHTTLAAALADGITRAAAPDE